MTCSDCSRPMGSKQNRAPGHVRHDARGLCVACYARRRRNGTLNRHPTSNKTRPPRTTPITPAMAAVIEDIEWLVTQRTRMAMAARRLGKTETAIERALYRAGRGDLVTRLKVGAGSPEASDTPGDTVTGQRVGPRGGNPGGLTTIPRDRKGSHSHGTR